MLLMQDNAKNVLATSRLCNSHGVDGLEFLQEKDMEQYIENRLAVPPSTMSDAEEGMMKEAQSYTELGRAGCASILKKLVAGVAGAFLITVVTFHAFPTQWMQALVEIMQEHHEGATHLLSMSHALDCFSHVLRRVLLS
jgi:hypothetical protein